MLNEPAVPDAEYDRLMKELREIEAANPALVTPDSPTQRVSGVAASEFAEARHAIPMLSLENGFTDEDLVDFDRKVRERLGGTGRSTIRRRRSSMASPSRCCFAMASTNARPRAAMA